MTVLVTNSVEVGITLDGTAYHQGGDISGLRDDGSERLDQLLGWPAVQRRAAELRAAYPESLLPESGLDLHAHPLRAR